MHHSSGIPLWNHWSPSAVITGSRNVSLISTKFIGHYAGWVGNSHQFTKSIYRLAAPLEGSSNNVVMVIHTKFDNSHQGQQLVITATHPVTLSPRASVISSGPTVGSNVTGFVSSKINSTIRLWHAVYSAGQTDGQITRWIYRIYLPWNIHLKQILSYNTWLLPDWAITNYV